MQRGEARAAIVDAALAILDGEDQRLTYDGVAQRAGVSRQTVYAHFPTRSDLLLAAVGRARDAAGLEASLQSVYDAPTAREALRAFVGVNVSFVPAYLRAHVAVERERSADPEVEAAFAGRASGRRQLVRLVATRLQAEGDLAPPWTVDTACDLIHAFSSGTTTAQLVRDAGWDPDVLGERLLLVLERSLLEPTSEEP